MLIPAGLLLLLLCTASCGKKGALIYPEMVAPSAPVEVTARQTGSEVIVSFQLPQRDLAGRPLNGLAGVKIFRQAADASQGGACLACSADYPLFRTIYIEHPGTAVQLLGNSMMMLDDQVHSGTEYAYSIQFFLQDGTTGSASLPVKVSVVPALKPPVLIATATPTEIRLNLSARSSESNIFRGFLIYRSIKGQPFSYVPYTKEPVTTGTFLDFGLQHRVVYTYTAKTIMRIPNGALVESDASDVVEAQLLEDLL